MEQVESSLPIICITSGEPAGIGPDIILQAIATDFAARLVVLGSVTLFSQRAAQLGLTPRIQSHNSVTTVPVHEKNTLHILPIATQKDVIAGLPEVDNADYVFTTLERACDGTLAGEFDAIVTPPVNKAILCETGKHFSGHTEFFQHRCKSDQVVMMLATQGLRVALATTHLPLQDVSAAITESSLTQIIQALNKELQTKFATKKPKILVCGLNPHAGEDGHLGREEIDTIIPTLDKLRQEGINLIGPLPADTLFTPKYLTDCDCVLAMYHDQGLPVLKYKGFGKAVNITLGLPIIRTSVDHGTAFDLAATGQADAGSLIVAIEQAITMANNSNGKQQKESK
ncbi:4-hydroxythreonine-4-phosphate dehydrogenase PdxA [Marinomonas agarivorans]|nr:4-hydroxythreonine-4-phosphate dehydrogenase PdxA [Marinomonas agarivorans]